MVSVSDFLNNIKTLVGKYHYTKTQSDLKYVSIDDLNDAILAELTPAQSNPSVTVNVTNLSNSEEDIFVYLTDDVYTLNDPQALTNGVATFNNVTSGTYYVVLGTIDEYDNASPIGAKEVTVSDSNMTVSFTVRDVDVYEYSDEMGSENAAGGGNGFSVLDANTNCEISTDNSSVLLADGEYMSNGYEFYENGNSTRYVIIGSENSRITFFVQASQEDPEMEP